MKMETSMYFEDFGGGPRGAKSPPEGNLEGRGGVFYDTSLPSSVYVHSLILDREGLDLTLSGCTILWLWWVRWV